jgi:transcriptional regulator with XRE-family HTH domain
MTIRHSDGSVDAIPFLQSLGDGPLTFGRFIRAIRLGEEWTLDQMGRRLGTSRAHLCDIEKGRRSVTASRAARWARQLGYDETQMVRLALQAELQREGVPMIVEVRPASVRRRPRAVAYRTHARRRPGKA